MKSILEDIDCSLTDHPEEDSQNWLKEATQTILLSTINLIAEAQEYDVDKPEQLHKFPIMV